MTLPDFMTDPNAVLKDKDHQWRYGRVPDYSKVNKAFEEGNNNIYTSCWVNLFMFNRKNHEPCWRVPWVACFQLGQGK